MGGWMAAIFDSRTSVRMLFHFLYFTTNYILAADRFETSYRRETDK